MEYSAINLIHKNSKFRKKNNRHVDLSAYK